MRIRSLRSRSPRIARHALAVALAAPLVLALVACGGGSTTDAPPAPAQLATLTITGPLDTLTELTSRSLRVAGVDTKGQPLLPTNLTWQSSDTTVLGVSTGGDIIARRIGSATVTAQSGTVSTTLTVRIVPAVVWTIGLSLSGAVSTDTLLVGTTATLVAEPRDIGGRPLIGRTVTFAAADTSRATVVGNKVTGRAVGLLDVITTVDTVARHGILIVRPTAAGKVAVKLANPKRLGDTLWVGLKDSAIVSFADAAGQPLSAAFRSIAYSVDDPKIATVDAQGRVTPVAVGTATLTATADRVSGTVPLRVYVAPITSVIAAPDTVRVLPGETSQIRPILIDGAGLRVSALGTRTVKVDALDPSIATVDAQGNVRGVALGTARVRVTSDRGSGIIPVRVMSPIAGADAFHITLRFVGPVPSQAVIDAFTAAKARWENVIRRSIGSDTITLAKGDCGSTDAVHTERVTDVLIFASIDSIDGPSNILGSASPCVVADTSGRWLPMIGRMRFDSADMTLMSTTGRLGAVITHEMGHVLGIGTLWDARWQGRALANQVSGDPRYFGNGGTVASAGMGFTGSSLGISGSPVLESVPLENTGGSGTAGSHWRRSVFGNELMNGFAGTGPQPLSLLTLLAMSDLGYLVNTSYAESWGSFILAPTPASASLGVYFRGPATQINEMVSGPEFTHRHGARLERVAAKPPL